MHPHYVKGAALHRGFETQWDVGFDQYETISRQVPTMVAEGNHETDWPGRRPVGANDRWADTATDSGDSLLQFDS